MLWEERATLIFVFENQLVMVQHDNLSGSSWRERDRERAVVMEHWAVWRRTVTTKELPSAAAALRWCGGCCCDVLCPLLAGMGWCRHCTALRRILMENATFTKTGSAETKEHWDWATGRCLAGARFVHNRCHLHHSPTSTIFRGNLTIFGEGTSAILVSEILVLKP